MKGVFITFEGIEGSGKSTQIALLAQYLWARGSPVTLTREPGGTAIGDRVRAILLDPNHKTLDPKAELLLYAAARAQHLQEVILPALKTGGVVLCDRFSDATAAYQGYGRSLDLDMISALDRIVTGGMQPDLTLLLDIDAVDGLDRARGRNRSRGLDNEARFENEEVAFHERVRAGYRALAKQQPGRIRVVDASRPVDFVQADIRKIVDARMGS
jgi:dTMP kinase